MHTSTPLLCRGRKSKCEHSGNNLPGTHEWHWNHIVLMGTLCVWRVLCTTPEQLYQQPSGQMSSWCVKVMLGALSVSFHSSFHFKALYMLAQRDEVWIWFLPLPQSNLSQAARTACPGCSTFWTGHLNWILMKWWRFIIGGFFFSVLLI